LLHLPQIGLFGGEIGRPIVQFGNDGLLPDLTKWLPLLHFADRLAPVKPLNWL
jgi:hypothetical protein